MSQEAQSHGSPNPAALDSAFMQYRMPAGYSEIHPDRLNGGYRVEVFDAAATPWAAAETAAFINQLIRRNDRGLAKPCLWRLDPLALMRDRTRLVLVRDRAGLAAVCHFVGSGCDLHLLGLGKRVGSSSRGPRLAIAHAVDDGASQFGDAIRFVADIRKFPSGFVDDAGVPVADNQASRKLFEGSEDGFGFEADVLPEAHKINGDWRDSHLFESAEPDGQTVYSITLRSTERTVQLAQKFIAENSSVEVRQ